MGHWEDLEKLFTTLYLKEIDQEENVWRSLPFFSATLAVEVVVLNQVLPLAADIDGWLWWVLVSAGCLLACMILSVLVFLYRSIRRQSFSYIASGRALIEYVRQLEAAQGLATSAEGAPSIRDQVRHTLIGQLSAATDANRMINQSRAAERTRAGILLLATIVATLIFVGVTIGHEVGTRLQEAKGDEAGQWPAGARAGNRPTVGADTTPASGQ